MPVTADRTESLFAAAVELSPADRAAFLDRECAGDEALRQQLDGLLAAHDRASHLLDHPAARQDADAAATTDETPDLVGTIVAGRYKLLEEIGEGGMGSVWVAEQTEPVHRKVALKLIKPGMDSRSVLARFEAERQALAMMDHPNIAKVLDGGLTEAARPYFVMEYVKGVPITEYCDATRLSVADRLDLFIQVCSAVQHAHQKGIIHRDLKPSNILVAPYDDKPVPKVIDFGLAKALHQRLTERTLHTAHETVIGTPLYMSPEQAQLNNLDVDTRTDIYSLGVLLYELLTGTTPLEKARFKEAAWDEIRRIIRDEEPPRPSTRLSSTGTLPSLAACRQTEPVTLTKQLRGELDWIVMKALEKDRTRRYETATGLAKDVQRYLAGEAVEACPPSLRYRLKKAYRKNRVAIMTSGIVAAAMIVGIIISTWQAIRATSAERAAVAAATREAKERANAEQAAQEREKTIEVFSDVLEQFNPYRHATGNPSIQEVLAQACDSLDQKDELTPLIRAKVRGVFGQMYVKLHLYKEGQAQLKLAYEEVARELKPDHLDSLAAREEYANAIVEGRSSIKDLKDAEAELRNVHAARVRVQGAGHPDTLETLSESLGRAIFYQQDYPRLAELRRRALRDALANPDLGENHEVTAGIQVRLANVLMRSGDKENLDEARDLCRRAIRTHETKLGPNDPSTLRAKMQLVAVSDETTDFADSAKRVHELTDLLREACDTEYDERVDRAYSNLAFISLLAGDLSIADEFTQKVLKTTPQLYGERHPSMRLCYTFRGWYYVQAGEYEQAEVELSKVFSPAFEELSGLEGGWDDNSRTLSYALLAECILHRDPQDDDFIRAEEYLRKVEELEEKLSRQLGSPMRFDVLITSHRLQQWVNLYTLWNKPDEAAIWQKKLDKLTQK